MSARGSRPSGEWGGGEGGRRGKKRKKEEEERRRRRRKKKKKRLKAGEEEEGEGGGSARKRQKKRMKQKMKRQSKGVGGGPAASANGTKSNWERLQETLRKKRNENASLMPDSKRKGKKWKRGDADADGLGGEGAASADGTSATASTDFDPSMYIACDAEMVGVGAADTSALARVSLTDWHGRVLYDKFVKPRGRVTNYRTWVSGIRKRDLQHAMPFARAKADVKALLEGKILVGHAVHNDLKCLELNHPDESVRDTAQYPPLMRRNPATGKLQPRKLKDLSEQIGYAIQSGSHSSVEDAQATMRVYRHYKKDWDAWLDSGGKYVPPAVPDLKSGTGGKNSEGRRKQSRHAEDPFASKHKKRRRREALEGR
eukprot:g281.t1